MTTRLQMEHPKTSPVELQGEGLRIEELIAIARSDAPVRLAPHALEKVQRARACVESKLASGEAYYGINTGFGALAEVRIPDAKLSELQVNLIRSHACGVGEPLAREVVRAVLALRIQTMLRGHSGVSQETIALMAAFLNHDVTPYVPAKGSVGASGDLAPLAHIALALLGLSLPL